MGRSYTIDFNTLQQINEDTGTARAVQRKVNATAGGSQTAGGVSEVVMHHGFQMFHKSTLEIHGNENAYIDNYDNYIIIGFFYDKDKLNSIYPSYTVSRLL